MSAREEIPPSQSAVQSLRRVARLCGLGAMLIGVSGILGWITGIPELNSIIPGLKPIAISAALVYLLLGGTITLVASTGCDQRLQIALLSVTGFCMIFGLLELLQLITKAHVSIEDAILQHYPALFNNPQVHIAPIAMVLLFLIGLGLTLHLSQCIGRTPRPMVSQFVGIIGSLVALVGLTSLMGYFYGTPFLLGREFLPIAALAALAGLLLGIGLVALAGDKVFPLSQFTGVSTQARLLRAFLPLTAGLMLILSIVQFYVTRLTLLSPVIMATLHIGLFVIIVGAAIRQVARIIGTAIDRAEEQRRQAEDELRRSETQLSTILENLTEGVIVSTVDGQLTHWNRAGLKMYGFADLDEARRQAPELTSRFEMHTLDGELLPAEHWPLPRILHGEVLRDWDVRMVRLKSVTERIYSYGGSLVYDTDGRPLMAIMTVTDVTERRQAEEELRQWSITLEERVKARTAELEASNKELEDFAYTVAHDLRSPLRSVAGFSEYVLKHYVDRLDARGRDYLQRMRSAAQRMGQLIDDLLNLARLSRMALRREWVNLSDVAASIVAGLRERTPERQVMVEIAPNLTVWGDRELLRNALANLLDNAWKFTRHSQHAIIAVGERIEQGEHVYYVRDNGIGFSMTYANTLFQPFHRLHTEQEYPGTGIGLAIVQRIVQRHGGHVWAESVDGQGATFYFTLGKEQQ